jgi:hypothetical protein
LISARTKYRKRKSYSVLDLTAADASDIRTFAA